MRCIGGAYLTARIARSVLALVTAGAIYGPLAARAGNQLFEASWVVKSGGNDITTGTGGRSSYYYARGMPMGVQCNPDQPRCPFDSTPTDGYGDFSPLGGSTIAALYCAPWSNWQGYGATARPAKGGTDTTYMGRLRPPLYRNPGRFTSGGPARHDFLQRGEYGWIWGTGPDASGPPGHRRVDR